jgi:DNA-binding CsgD family transcriptional regulator
MSAQSAGSRYAVWRSSGDRRSSVLTLSGLDVAELGMLCQQLGRAELSERTLRRLADHTGGNPLLARALLDELTDDELRATDGSFRAPRSLAGLILPRLAALPLPARDLVVAASVLGEHAALADAAAVAATAEPAVALDKATRAGLLIEQDMPSGRAVSFPHLLIRQAVYHDLGAERRRRLHLRAAAILGGQEALAHRDDPAAFWWRPAQAWALIRTGRLGQAEAILAAIEVQAARRGESAALTQAAWLRGSLAMARGDLDQADEVLRAACGAARGQPLPFHSGLLNLQHGRCLSRLQRHRAAADAVRAARDVFSLLGAHPFLRASEAELACAGLRPRPDGDFDLPTLTSQELRVARLVASGLSNREAAAQLYLSPKTVEYHLAHAFTKLGVRSRHQLATRFRDRENPGNVA